MEFIRVRAIFSRAPKAGYKPQDELDFSRPKLFRVDGEGPPQPIVIDDALFGTPWRVSHQSWSADGSKFRFLVNERGHQRLAYYEVDVDSGAVRTLIDERSATFIDYSQKTELRVLEERGQVLWMSERSGWNHLYLIDLETAEARRGAAPAPGLPTSRRCSPRPSARARRTATRAPSHPR